VTFAYFRLGSNLRSCKTYTALSDPILYDNFSWNFFLKKKNTLDQSASTRPVNRRSCRNKKNEEKSTHACTGSSMIGGLAAGSQWGLAKRSTSWRGQKRWSRILHERIPPISHLLAPSHWPPPAYLFPPCPSPWLACFPLFVLLHTRARPTAPHHLLARA
jgi:hypothetical protein